MKILTFDIEEWFHILDHSSTATEFEWNSFDARIHVNVDAILDLLATAGQKATFFCLGWIARRYPDVIIKIASSGHEIASHSDMHQLVYGQSRAAFRSDVERSLFSLEDLIGEKIRTYRAPGFSITPSSSWAFETLAELGIEIDSSIFPAQRGHGGYPSFGTAQPSLIRAGGATLKEFPINLYSCCGAHIVFSGGGYFRLLPYPIVRHLMQRSSYVMTYFHPRDIDIAQPVLRGLPVKRYFKTYYGLKYTLRKLEKLLADFRFSDMRTADGQIDWESAHTVTVN